MSEEQNQSEKVPYDKRSGKKIQEQTIAAKKSYWPVALAFTICIIFMGIITNLVVVLAIGVVLAAASIIGWGLENR